MTDHNHQNQLPPEMLASLLQVVRRKQQRGDMAGARVVLRALVSQQPDDPRIWLALATAVETRGEQLQALERALALDPHNALARRALARFDTADEVEAATIASGYHPASLVAGGVEADARLSSHPTPPEVGAAPGPTPRLARKIAPDDNLAHAIRWPLYLVIGIAVALVLVAAVVLQPAPAPTAEAPAPTQALPGDDPTTGDVVPRSVASGATSPAVGSPIPAGPPEAAATTAALPAEPTALAPATSPPALAPGQIVTLKPWNTSLLRPEYGVLLDGAIGPLQPRGRFALALVAIGNDSPAPARIPADLFILQDRSGNRYQPLPNASTIYLNTYGRGQRGDLSLEEDIPPGGGIVSVPLIFDVPPDARDLTLRVGGQSLGWPLGGAAPKLAPTP